MRVNMTRMLFVGAGVVILAAACWTRYAERNHERAYVTRDGQIYRVELKGRRFPLVHDPLSLVVASTYEETFTLELPRIEGVIEGAEIHHRYLGRVVISNGRMTVDLYQPDEGARRPLSWNDEYVLMPKNTPGTR
jgi:hypothetical protein